MAASSSAGEVLPPSSLPYGYSYEEWSAKWWQFSLGQSTNHLESVGSPRICEGPASRVLFLAAPGLQFGGSATVTSHVSIFADTPLFFSILSTWVDNSGCPTFTSFTADQLTAQAIASWAGVATLTTCTIDGVAVPGLENPITTIYNVVSPPFSYTTAEKGNMLAGVFGEPCIPGGLTIYPAVADGVYLMLSPLSPGRHTIHAVGVAGPVSAPFVVEDITYDITVLRDSDHDGH
jgi:hypothetical protein